MTYIIYYDDELDTSPEVRRWPEAIARATGASVVNNNPGLQVNCHSDPAKLVGWINSTEARSAPLALVLDIHTQAQGRAITPDANCGFAVARAANTRWPRVPLIFLTMFPSESTEDLSAGEFPGYQRFITKRGPYALPLLEQTMGRLLDGLKALESGRLRIDPETRKVSWNGIGLEKPNELTDREFRLVDCIMSTCLAGAPRAIYKDILKAIGAGDKNAIFPLMTRVKRKMSSVAQLKFDRKDLFANDGEGYILVER